MERLSGRIELIMYHTKEHVEATEQIEITKENREQNTSQRR